MKELQVPYFEMKNFNAKLDGCFNYLIIFLNNED